MVSSCSTLLELPLLAEFFMSMPHRRLYRCRACQVEVFIQATRRPLESRCPECDARDFESVAQAGSHPRATVDELLAKALDRERRNPADMPGEVEDVDVH